MITNEMKFFTKFHTLNKTISTADRKTALHITGGGTIKLPLLGTKGMLTKITLPNVAYTPGAHGNLISLSHFLRYANLKAVVNESGFRFHKNGRTGDRVIAFASKDNGLYRLHLGDDSPTDQVALAVINFKDPM